MYIVLILLTYIFTGVGSIKVNGKKAITIHIRLMIAFLFPLVLLVLGVFIFAVFILVVILLVLIGIVLFFVRGHHKTVHKHVKKYSQKIKKAKILKIK